MEDKDLWTTFERTGNIVDYLNYKGIHAGLVKSGVSLLGDYKGTGEDKFESVGNRDRDDTVRNTYR